MIDKSKILIRLAEESDIDEVYLMEREYIIEHEFEQLFRWDSAKERNMKMMLDNIHRMFVATIDSKVIGHSYWSIYNDDPCVFSIYISKNYRNMGIATDLMIKVEEQIYKSNYKKITLSTLETNPAQYLFNKLNYEEIGRKDGWINYEKFLIV
ncbi:hypothetical protein SH1V18_33670 [Vallitalea longa]|uniref:N-acetyltransferase domain-containing protein n=1 Tax=Vallitalea longa TaxID=2936439 RepID=A0A9W6DGU2_9FIRM|nr:GNAT family N-acetyltransferase [Vallitalea longa]GKX30887.1 hypothetical protein SH1V18_33670 [Vallitalea longa]